MRTSSTFGRKVESGAWGSRATSTPWRTPATYVETWDVLLNTNLPSQEILEKHFEIGLETLCRARQNGVRAHIGPSEHFAEHFARHVRFSLPPPRVPARPRGPVGVRALDGLRLPQPGAPPRGGKCSRGSRRGQGLRAQSGSESDFLLRCHLQHRFLKQFAPAESVFPSVTRCFKSDLKVFFLISAETSNSTSREHLKARRRQLRGRR